MDDEQKYTPIEVIKEIVDSLKPKIEEDMKLAKAGSLFSGAGAQKAKGFGSILSGGSTPPPPPPVPVSKDEMENKKYSGGLKKFQMDKAEKFGSLSVNHFPAGHMHRGNEVVSAMHDHDNKMIHVKTKHGMGTKTHSYDIKNPPKHAFDTKKPEMSKACGLDMAKKNK